MAQSEVISVVLFKRNQLRIDYRSAGDGTQPTRSHVVDLDRYLGNNRGRFDTNDRSFSYTFRNINLKQNILYAELRDIEGYWWNDHIALDFEIPDPSSSEDLSVHFRYDNTILERCRNLRLIDEFLLAAQYPGQDMSYSDVYLDLELCLGVSNGEFVRNGFNLRALAKNIRLSGFDLCADLLDDKGNYHPSSISLRKIVHFEDNKIVPLRCAKEDMEFEFINDRPDYGLCLVNTDNLRLMNYKMKRYWYLMGYCRDYLSGSRSESAIRLHEILGPGANEMFNNANFSSPQIPLQSRETRLENGILTAQYQAWNSSGREEWVPNSIDLREVIETRLGRMSPKVFGISCPGCKHLFVSGSLYTPWSGIRRPLDLRRMKSERKRCTLCRLVSETARSYASEIISRNAYLETSREDVSPWVWHPDPRKVFLVFERENSNRTVGAAFSRATEAAPDEMRFAVLLELDGNLNPSDPFDSYKRTFLRVPTLYRTIPHHTNRITWFEPGRRWERVNSWIEACQRFHSTCQRPAPPELPSRYLDLGPSDTSPVKLAISVGHRGRYACLSHCWGGYVECTLTARSKASFVKEIPRQALPPVFIDAINTCRKLGLRYLWIDSLCIKQDSRDDWQSEAYKMGQYYTNCTVCIAASTSANSTRSFDIRKNPRAIRSQGTDPTNGTFQLIACPKEDLDARKHFVHIAGFENILKEYPLFTRAWVLQERFLAPRTLHFSDTEVIFECALTTTCECSAIELNKKHSTLKGLVRATTNQEGAVPRRINIEDILWIELVSIYSALQLTCTTDRFIAFSGIASAVYEAQTQSSKSIEGELQAIYLAGLWRDSLINDLAWFVGQSLLHLRDNDDLHDATGISGTRKPRPERYIAPSWSWASALDPVQYFIECGSEPLCEILDAYVNLESENPFGSVGRGSFIKIRGGLIETSWERLDHTDGTNSFRLRDIIGTQQLDTADRKGISFSPDFAFDNIDLEAPLSVLPLATQQIKFSSGVVAIKDSNMLADARSTICLVLSKTAQAAANRDIYERVGFTEYANYADGVWNMDPNTYTEVDLRIL